jgi:integrase/recombinase XerD
MEKFEHYLIRNGIQWDVAAVYARNVSHYLVWVKENNLRVKSVKRMQFSKWLQSCREQGNKERTLRSKELAVKKYYYFLGCKNNPALSWMKRKKEHTLPEKPLSREELLKLYQSMKPSTPVMHRDRSMLGMVLFQGLLRSELTELRIQDLDFDNCTVFIQGQRRTNSRKLSMKSFQVMHLYDYMNKYRQDFIGRGRDQRTDRVFLSRGSGDGLHNTLARLLVSLRRTFPQLKDLKHIRGSVITHWQDEDGLMEAMVKAGHRYVSSTERYRTTRYEELQDQLKSLHPLENMDWALSTGGG